MTTIIKASAIITNSKQGIIRDGFISISGNRITDIGLQKNLTTQTLNSTTVLDWNDRILSPGFVQTHIHLCQTLFRGLADDLLLLDWLQKRIFPFENAHSESSMKASAQLGLAEMLANGTTTIMDMGSVRHYEQVLETAIAMGMRGYFGKALMDANDLFPALMDTTSNELKNAESQLKTYHHAADDRIRYAMTPRFILSCSDELLVSSKAIARKYDDVLYHTHSSEQQAELAVIRQKYGYDNVDYFDHLGLLDSKTLLAHCVWLNENEKNVIREKNVKILHCPSSNLKLGSGVALIPELKESGISVSIGADGAPCNNNLDPFVEMRLAALIQKPRLNPTAMPAKQVFEMATIGGAEALGLESQIGSLEVGKKADFIGLNLNKIWNPLLLESVQSIYSAIVYSSQKENVTDVWIDGRVIKKGGELLGVNEEQIFHQSGSELKKLLDRV